MARNGKRVSPVEETAKVAKPKLDHDTESPTPNASTAGERDRLRVFRACDRCKRKKIKCDGLRPCLPCSKGSVECTYTPTAYNALSMSAMRMFREPVPTENIPMGFMSPTDLSFMNIPPGSGALGSSGGGHHGAASKPGTVAALLERNKKLENLLQSLQNRGVVSNVDLDSLEDTIPETAEELNVRGMVRDMNNGPDSLPKSGNMAPEDFNTSITDVEYQAFSKFRYSKRYIHVLGNVFGRSLYENLPNNSQRLVTLPRVQAYGWNLSGAHFLTQKDVPKPPTELPQAMVDELLEYYFDKVNPLFAFLHPAMFMKQYETYMSSKADKTKSQDLFLFSALLHCVLAISMRFSETDHKKDYPPGLEEELFTYSYEMLRYFSFQWESVEIVQGWLLLAMYLRAAHRQSSTWMALGEAVRLCNGMGLGKSCWISPPIPKYCSLKIIRVFWAVFTWDRLLAIDTGRSFSVNEEEISLPPIGEYVDDGWLTKPAYLMIKLALSVRPLEKDIGYGLAQTSLDQMNKNLTNWNHQHAAKFGADNDSDYDKAFDGVYDPSMVAQIRCYYHESILYANSRTLFAMIDSQWENSTSVHRKLISDSAKGIILVLDKLDDLGRLETIWWTKLSSLYNASLSLLVLLNSAGIDHRNLGRYITRGIGLADKFASNPRFTMAKEAQWALRTLSHLVYLRFRDCQNILKLAGIEHGDEDVNKRRFSSMGRLDSSGKLLIFGNEERDGKLPPNHGVNPIWRAKAEGTVMTSSFGVASDGANMKPPSATSKQSSEADSSEAWEFQPPPFDESPDGMFMQGQASEDIGVQASAAAAAAAAANGTTEQEAPNPVGSLDWFNGFTWDENNSAASFPNMGN